MIYQFSIAKQIAEKGFFLRLTADVEAAPGRVELHGVEDPEHVGAMEFAVNYFFERCPELRGQGCRIEVSEFEAVPYDTGLLCVVLGTLDIVCQHFEIASKSVMYLDDRGNFCFPA